ncbi:hypothetical protein PGTUg99_022904 [Puccinia graminis f. sp. tritici]|nr:hypothetical protein PGTUg99_022904 [Puccinia graminis f. sp. tritici]
MTPSNSTLVIKPRAVVVIYASHCLLVKRPASKCTSQPSKLADQTTDRREISPKLSATLAAIPESPQAFIGTPTRTQQLKFANSPLGNKSTPFLANGQPLQEAIEKSEATSTSTPPVSIADWSTWPDFPRRDIRPGLRGGSAFEWVILGLKMTIESAEEKEERLVSYSSSSQHIVLVAIRPEQRLILSRRVSSTKQQPSKKFSALDFGELFIPASGNHFKVNTISLYT